jgi:uncharacterized RDD family membrane protein YckC
METPKPPDEPGPDEPPSPGAPPPPPGGPQAPAGPQAPGGPQAPAGPQAPVDPADPRAPAWTPPQPAGPHAPGQPPPPPPGPHAPYGAPEGPPAYGGPVPPGGWEQPIVQQPPGWHGQPLASWGTRLAAYLIDVLILLVPVVILAIVVIAVAAGSDTGAILTGVLSFFAYLIVLFIYAPVLMAREGVHNGQTWGKQLLDIRVVRDTGQPMSFGWAALREIVIKQLAVGIASSIIPFIPWFLDYFWPLWDDQNRALHDMVVSTHVVQA